MTLWIIFAAMTIITLVWVLYPVLRSGKVAASEQGEEQAYDSAVYRDQLQELERDAERGLINEKEKESALNEVSRRLLNAQAQASQQKTSGSAVSQTRKGHIITVVSVLAVAGFAGLLYKKIGRPELPDQPQEQRIKNASKNGDMPALIMQVQRFLEKSPKDIRGWNVLAPALKRARRYSEAAQAYATIMELDKPTPPLLVDYAESLLLANKGQPTDQVKQALKSALAMDETYAKARFYWAMALQQEGERDKALVEWRKLLAQNPKNLQLQMAVQRQIAALTPASKPAGNLAGKSEDAKMPALDKSQREAAASMTPKERQAMIAAMVSRLADRLQENGKDLAGWQKLIRARMILGQREAAATALKTAQDNFKDDKAALASLEQFSATLGLNQ